MDYNTIVNLIREFQQGNIDAFNDIYEGAYKLVYGQCYGMLRSEEDALDMTQESFVSIYEKLGSLEAPETYSKWMVTIARNKCLNFLEKNNRISYTDNDMDLDLASGDWSEVDGLSDSFIEDNERKEIINKVLKDSLSEVQYQMLFMRYFNDMKEKEIADAMSCPLGTVKSGISNAKKRFKSALEKYIIDNKIVLAAAPAGSAPFFTRFFASQISSVTMPGAIAAATGAGAAAASVSSATTAASVGASSAAGISAAGTSAGSSVAGSSAAAAAGSSASASAGTSASTAGSSAASTAAKAGFFSTVGGKIAVGGILMAGLGGIGFGGYTVIKDIIKPEPLELNRYVTYSVSGYNNTGTLTYSIDYSSIIKDNDQLEGVTPEQLQAVIGGGWDKSESLSNGDNIKFTWVEGKDLEEFEKDHKIDLQYEDIAYTVKDLEDLKKINLFDYVEVSFEGRDGSGKATVKVMDDIPVKDLVFDVSQRERLSNDQSVIITVRSKDGKDIKELLTEAGYAYDETSKDETIVVSGLEEVNWKDNYITLAESYQAVNNDAKFALIQLTSDDIPELVMWHVVWTYEDPGTASDPDWKPDYNKNPYVFLSVLDGEVIELGELTQKCQNLYKWDSNYGHGDAMYYYPNKGIIYYDRNGYNWRGEEIYSWVVSPDETSIHEYSGYKAEDGDVSEPIEELTLDDLKAKLN